MDDCWFSISDLCQFLIVIDDIVHYWNEARELFAY